MTVVMKSGTKAIGLHIIALKLIAETCTLSPFLPMSLKPVLIAGLTTARMPTHPRRNYIPNLPYSGLAGHFDVVLTPADTERGSRSLFPVNGRRLPDVNS